MSDLYDPYGDLYPDIGLTQSPIGNVGNWKPDWKSTSAISSPSVLEKISQDPRQDHSFQGPFQGNRGLAGTAASGSDLTGDDTENGKVFWDEIKRLATFITWPKNGKSYPSRLASAGFMYIGKGMNDEVMCFVCDIKITNWQLHENPFEKHKFKSPSCSFILGISNNALKTSLRTNNENLLKKTDIGTTFLQYSTGAATNEVEDTISSQSMINLRNSGGRMRTYNDWPITSPIMPLQLAEAGFYFTGQGDIVQCFNCNIKIGNWKSGDNPIEEHRKRSTDCQIVIDYLSQISSLMVVSSLPSSSINELVTTDDLSKISNKVQIKIDNDAVLQIIEDLPDEDSPIIQGRAKYPEYGIIEKRLQSFETWPEDITQRPSELVAAGFIYAGYNDNVKCFFCGGGLRNWRSTDDPWEEHARWFPKCGFLRLSKDTDFITQYAKSSNKNTVKLPRNAEFYMTKSAVQQIQDLGYSDSLIEKAVEGLLKKTPSLTEDFPRVVELLDEVFTLEELTPDSVPDDKIVDDSHDDENVKIMEDQDQSVLSKTQKMRTENKCKKCHKKHVSIVCIPCSHLAMCEDCVLDCTQCPVCHVTIRAVVRTYTA